MNLEPAECGSCGTVESSVWMTVPSLRLRGDSAFTLRECSNCGMVRLSPRPTQAEFAILYQPNLYTAPRRNLVRHLEGLILRERVGFMRRHVTGRRVLDVGCGNGSFIEHLARHGANDVWGLEPFQQAPAGVSATLHSRIRCESIADAGFTEGSFDIITLWHVLEHLDQPLAALAKLAALLAPRGRLVLEVPNISSHEARWLGPQWYNLDAPYHLWHFTPATLRALVSRAGFEVTHCVTSAITRPVWLLNYLMLGGEAASRRWKSPWWKRHPGLAAGFGLLACSAHRMLFAGSCPMVRLICRLSAPHSSPVASS